LINIGEAQRKILEEIQPLGNERIHISEALGRVLGTDIVARRDVPMHDNSAMDGFACRHADIAGASEESWRALRLIGESPAGRPFRGSVGPGQAVRILTGGMIPDGADTVVMVEDTAVEGDEVRILADPGKRAHIRPRGEDVREGETVLHKGDIVRPPEIAMAATLGYAYVYVHQRPVVAILSTGDELVDVDEPFTVGKVICSNTYSLSAQVRDCGAISLSLGVARDDAHDQRNKLAEGLRADVLVTSGGVSVGKYDLVKDTLAELGLKLKFWKVRMKPGKPVVFGEINGKPVFGLPGNPTSAMISFEQFVRPALLKMMGHIKLFRSRVDATLAEGIPTPVGRPHLMRCRLFDKDGTLTASVAGNQSSGALRSMVMADGLLLLEPDRNYPAGTRMKAQVLHTNSPLSSTSPYE
jgi:molybdopterin molybdotransferase